VQSTSQDKIVLLPTSGGSLPLSIITERLNTVTISVPIANLRQQPARRERNIRLAESLGRLRDLGRNNDDEMSHKKLSVVSSQSSWSVVSILLSNH
jgi:hypothetical protein